MNSEVSRIELNQDGTTINLVVDIYGFEAGAPVEISGSATQENGAVASFYSVQPAPDPSTPSVNVGPVAAVPPNTFDAGSPVTVVARAAQVWISNLVGDTSAEALTSRVVTTPLKAAWNKDGAHWAVAWPGQDAPAAW